MKNQLLKLLFQITKKSFIPLFEKALVAKKQKLLKKFSGFTIVELVVVVILLALLIAAGVPAYTNHIISTQFNELLMLAQPYKEQTEQAFRETGAPPSDAVISITSSYVSDIQLWQYNNIEFIHIKPINFYPGWDASQPLILKGQVVNDTLVWTCCWHPSAPIPTKYLPKACNTCCTDMNVACP